MVASFTVLGSCASRDVFFSEINSNYKDFFSIGEDGIRISLISLMQKPLYFEEEYIKVDSSLENDILLNRWIKKDFEKTFLEILKENNFQYLLMDTYYDINFGVLEFEDLDGNISYITNNVGLSSTDFYQNLNNKKTLSIFKNTDDYFNLWKKNCNLFFNFLKENCPNTQVILNPVRDVYNLLTKNNEIIESDILKKYYIRNKFRIMLDSYICNNFDVDVLYFDSDTLAYENHKWGLNSFHYYTNYFTSINEQLNNIIKRDSCLNQNRDLININKEFRDLKRQIAISNFNSFKERFVEKI